MTMDKFAKPPMSKLAGTVVWALSWLVPGMMIGVIIGLAIAAFTR